jgi:arylsulfatase A-like enzyme
MANKPYRQKAVVEWDRYGKEYPGDEILKLRRIYWGMVSYIDTEAGKLFDHLQARKLEEDTIVIFTTDHGDYMGDHRMIRKGPHVYEALVHVPLLMRWAGHFAARSTPAMVSNIDILPTLLDLAGLPIPDRIQGRSFGPVLRGESELHRECVFFEHGIPGNPLRPGDLSPEQARKLEASTGHHLCDDVMRGPTKGVRSERWKYCITPGDVDELYDLEADPHELKNLAADPRHSDVVREHRQRLLEWLIETEDEYPRDASV